MEVDFEGLDRSWMPTLPGAGPVAPIELVVLGHFDDDRAAFCPAELVQACRDRFVVDQVVSVAGDERPGMTLVEPRVTSRDAGTVAEQVASQGQPVLSVTGYEGGSITRAEPSLTLRPELMGGDAYWVVRLLEGGTAVRYLVVDGADTVDRLGAGPPVPVDGFGSDRTTITPSP